MYPVLKQSEQFFLATTLLAIYLKPGVSFLAVSLLLSEGQSFSVVVIWPYVSSNFRYFSFKDPKTGVVTDGGRLSFSLAF